MRKIMVALLCALSITATSAHAEHKLFATDVLDARQIEVEADFNYGHNSNDYSIRSHNPLNGTVKYLTRNQSRNTLISTYALGVGIGYGLQLNAAIPFVFSDKITLRSNRIGFTSYQRANFREHEGLGDIAVGLKYRLYENKERPLSVVAGIDLKLRTAESSKAGTGTTDFAPFLAASTIIRQNLKPYASYQAIIRDHRAGTSHTVSAGVEYQANKVFTLTPRISATYSDSKTIDPYRTYLFGLSGYINIYPDFYLIPHFNAGKSTPTKDWLINYDTTYFFNAGLAMYYLFN